MKYGMLTARRGWAQKQDVINAMTLEELEGWLNRRR
jgi:histidinol phosphatase-like PHP family hydrolase